MGKYSEFISLKRRPVETPESLVKDGIPVFGTFDKEFINLNLLDVKKPTALPNSFNKIRLTLWEAVELKFKEGMMLIAVSDMAIFGITKVVFFDYRSREVYTFDNTIPSKETVISKNLLNGDRTFGESKNSSVEFINNFEIGEAHIKGYSKNDVDIAEFDFHLRGISKPSVVSIPFGENRPLYTEKLLFKAEGRASFNGEEFDLSEAYAIIDDHRGYYPRRAHYDWLCSMGKCESDGKMVEFGFNLTRNQSTNPEDYNENLLWLNDKLFPLPPVTFEKKAETKILRKGLIQEVRVKDEHGMVDLTYMVEKTSAMITHAVVVKIDYYITFGRINGYILDEDGNKYIFNDTEAIGEDKTLLL